MAKQRMINTRIWEDNWFSNLDQIEQLVFIYFLTNPMTNIIGAYELSKGTISRAVGLEIITLDEILKRFKRDKKIYYIDGWVIISNFIKYQNYNSPKIQKGIEIELKSVPQAIKELVNIPYIYGIDTPSHSNTNSNTNSNKIRLVKKPTDRKSIKFSKEKMNKVIKSYELLKEVKFNGQEYLPIQQSIKTMFMSNRSVENIIACMEWMSKNEFYKDKWTINTVKTKLPEFIAGKLKKRKWDTL